MNDQQFICQCNNCNSLFYDENPQKDQRLINLSELNFTISEMALLEEYEDGSCHLYRGCDNCKSDSFLKDINDISEILWKD